MSPASYYITIYVIRHTFKYVYDIFYNTIPSRIKRQQ